MFFCFCFFFNNFFYQFCFYQLALIISYFLGILDIKGRHGHYAANKMALTGLLY